MQSGGGSLTHLLSVQVGSGKADVSENPTYVGHIHVSNTTAAIAYLQIFWKAAASVTLGTTIPDVVLPVPASGGFFGPFIGEGWRTGGTAWSIAGTTTRTGNSAALLDVVIWKKN